jgi:hypothetical protein
MVRTDEYRVVRRTMRPGCAARVDTVRSRYLCNFLKR